MKNNAFSAGVALGGLRDKQEIKVLICYIIEKMPEKFKKMDISTALQNEGLVNYFETSEAFSELAKNGHISENAEGFCNIEESGKLIANELEKTVPKSAKDRAVAIIENYLRRQKNERENSSTINKIDSGYNVVCNISGGDFEMLSLSIFAPDMDSALLVKNNFLDNPAALFDGVFKILTKLK